MYGTPPPPRARIRNPAQTRDRLLRAAFNEMHRAGFRAADLDAVMAEAGVTKGALYHHFAGKQAIGYAVVDEVIGPMTRAKWVKPLAEATDPLAELIRLVSEMPRDFADFDRGCPLNNLTVEMSPLDEGFRARTSRILQEWRDAIASALRRAQALGLVRRGVDPEGEAWFLIAGYWGYIALAKNSRDRATLEAGAQALVRQLESLRA
jgi:AcrR family transcriptional regulator